MLQKEGDEWKAYWYGNGRNKYKKALATSISYVLLLDNILCGYLRCRNDDGFGIYIYDLLVDIEHRGKEYGRLLMEQVGKDFPKDTVYVMSDVDSYYTKLEYEKEGSIFIVTEKS